MAKTVEQIRAQIAKLQEREKSLLQKEAVGVIERIKEAVAHYGITSEQIFGAATADASGGARRGVSRKAPAKAAKAPRRKGLRVQRGAKGEAAAKADTPRAASPAKGVKIAPKYRDDAGNTWTGRGSQPRWVRAALEGGKKLEDFMIS